MKTFDHWLLEMANLFPQRKGDTIERTGTTHMGFPVYAPSIYWVILSRDRNKYPDGMTAKEIATELLDQSETRQDLRPGEEAAPENWKEILKTQMWPKFVRGINSMLAKSPDFEVSSKKAPEEGGRTSSVYVPTEDAIRRQGGTKFLKGAERPASPLWKKKQQPEVDKDEEEPIDITHLISKNFF